MRHKEWVRFVLVGVLLVGASVATAVVQYLVFHDFDNFLFYLLQDFSFLPMQVLLVGLIIERLLTRRQKRQIHEKMNMVVGAFFAEIGTELLGTITAALRHPEKIRSGLAVTARWDRKDFARAAAFALAVDARVDVRRLDLYELRDTLAKGRELMVRMLENPNLLERDRFTSLLWAVFHISDELEAREQLSDLPSSDEAHLESDIERAYRALAAEWVGYAEHLKSYYPYLFSLLVRTHPLQEHPVATVL